MGTGLLTKGDIVVDQAAQRGASEALTAAGGEHLAGLVFRTESGAEIPVDPALAALLSRVVSSVARGGSISIQTLPEQLTTVAAAGVLGVSRTTVMKLIRSGQLPATLVGTHHRVSHTDVMRLKGQRELSRAAAIESLISLD